MPPDIPGRTAAVPSIKTALNETHTSAVSWRAIFAGAIGAAALSMILLILGFGLGISTLSPLTLSGAGMAAIGFSTILWLAFVQIVASALGGYLAGRLHTKWTRVDGDEAYFRDAAHGFLSWAVSTLMVAVLFASVFGVIARGGLRVGATGLPGIGSIGAFGVTQVVGWSDQESSPTRYFVDSLFREDPADLAGHADGVSRGEIANIFIHTGPSGQLPAEDLRYIAQVVARRTGLTSPEAEKRVSESYERTRRAAVDAESAAREAADNTRKAAAQFALWVFVALVVGALAATFAATLGGQRRDQANDSGLELPSTPEPWF